MNGGRRKGAGRKKGSLNKRTEAQIKACEEGGITPLQYMLNLLQDDQADKEDRKWAAQNAAPYLHAKLKYVEVGGEVQHSYVAEIPAPIAESDEWQERSKPH